MLDVNKDEFIVFDTETTGIDPDLGHKIIEIGAVRYVDGKMTDDVFHEYIDPQREIPYEAMEVHGLSRQDCVELGNGKTFADVADDLIHFFEGTIAVAHNAPFDTGFLDYELSALGKGTFTEICTVIDSLGYANGISPTKKNSLDHLAKRYGITEFDRSLHGALLDSKILAETFMAMRKSQNHLNMNDVLESAKAKRRIINLSDLIKPISKDISLSLPVMKIDSETQKKHEDYLSGIDKELSW